MRHIIIVEAETILYTSTKFKNSNNLLIKIGRGINHIACHFFMDNLRFLNMNDYVVHYYKSPTNIEIIAVGLVSDDVNTKKIYQTYAKCQIYQDTNLLKILLGELME